jgi:hypothetical protein
MKPRDSQANSPQENLFQARLDQQLNPNHPLFRLAQQIDWSYFEREFGAFYSEEMGGLANPRDCWSGCTTLNTPTTRATSRWSRSGWSPPTGNTSMAMNTFNTNCHAIRRARSSGDSGSKPKASRRCCKRFSRRRSAVKVSIRNISCGSTLTPQCRRKRSPSRPMRGFTRKPVR